MARRGAAYRICHQRPRPQGRGLVSTPTHSSAGLRGTQFGLPSGCCRTPEGARVTCGRHTDNLRKKPSVFPEKDAPEPQGGARVEHALRVVLPGRGAGPPEVAGRSPRLVVSAADREGEAGARRLRGLRGVVTAARLEAGTARCRAVG